MLNVVTGHVDRSNQIQPTRTDKFKVQISDPIDVWTVQELPENVLGTSGRTSSPTRKRRLRSIRKTATTASRRPTRMEPMASGVAEPVN